MNFLDYRKTYSRDSESTKGQVGFGRVRFFSVSNFFLHLFFNLFFKLGFREQERGKKKKKSTSSNVKEGLTRVSL